MSEGPVEHLAAASVIYKATEEDSTVPKNELLQLSLEAIRTVKNMAGENSERFKKLVNIPLQVSYGLDFLKVLSHLSDEDADFTR